MIIRDYVAPMVLGREIESPEDVPQLTGRVRGNKMARGAVECAVWDLEARRQGKPLWRLLGGTQEEINCGVSIGLEDSDAAMLKKVEKEVAAGYQRIKIKIKPGRDYEMIKAIREAGRTPVQRNTFYEPIKVLSDGAPSANEAEPPSGKSKVLEDNLATA